MGRVLFFVLLALAAYVGYRWWRLQQRRTEGGGVAGGAGRRPAAEPIVRCEACGLNVPRSEALSAPGGAWYCCEEHRQQGPSAR